MKYIISWCNSNQGFLSAILSIITIFISILTIRMTYKIGKMPYKKSISVMPLLLKNQEKYIMDVMIINTGLVTILIRNICITNNDNLVIGHCSKIEPEALQPNGFIRREIEIYDDIENIKKHELDLNNHIKIIVYGYNGEKYIQSKGFPVG